MGTKTLLSSGIDDHRGQRKVRKGTYLGEGQVGWPFCQGKKKAPPLFKKKKLR